MIPALKDRVVIVTVAAAVEKKGRARSGAYAVSKAGVVVLTESIAEEARKFNVTGNCILPSTIDTPENRAAFPGAGRSRWAKPEDIAEVRLFLVSDESSVLNGAAIPVCGKS
jgi:NAD(P)-dependent dehydrogenase (short-subunit alcohol dehydrogenase family)